MGYLLSRWFSVVLSNICIVKAEPFHSIQQTSDFFITGLVYVWNLKEKWDTAKDQGPGARMHGGVGHRPLSVALII